MNITLNKLADSTGIITISVQESDYQSNVEAKLKEVSRKATLPGFRPGKVPTGVIKKMHGKSILVEEITSLLNETLNNYIKGIDVYIVGSPLPNRDKTDTIDWEVQKDFDFEFEIGWVSDFALDLSPAVSIPQYVMAVDNKMVDDIVTDLRNHHPLLEAPETGEADDILTGFIIVNGEEEKDIEIHLNLFSAEEVKPFLGLKVNDSLTLDIAKLPESTDTRAALLGLSKEEAKTATGQFTFTVAAITRFKPAEMNEEFFDIVLHNQTIKTEEEFRAEIKKNTIDEFEKESHYWLDLSIEQYYVEHTPITLSEEFVRKWIKEKNKNLPDEDLEKELPNFMKFMKWEIFDSKISKENNIKVEPEEVVKKTRTLFSDQLGLPLSETLKEKLFDKDAQKYLLDEDSRGENFIQVYQEMVHEKVLNFIKGKITLNRKEVNADEYKKVISEESEKCLNLGAH